MVTGDAVVVAVVVCCGGGRGGGGDLGCVSSTPVTLLINP